MLNKTRHWILILAVTLFAALFMLLGKPVQASAAQVTDPPANSCLTCHEDLYYLHDSGKLYCLTDHTDRCINCHEGNETVMKRDESHLGLIAHPQENSGEKCQECHTAQDADARLAKFSSEGGFDTVIKAAPYTPSVEAETAFPEESKASPLFENWKWLTGAFVLFGLWLTLVIFSPLKP